MASIGGLTSSTSSSVNGLQGYGGLASGINRDELIEQLTSGTQSKIDAKNQEKTKLEWEQSAIREITDMIYDFTQKYASYSSSSNILGSSFFNRTDIAITGAFKDYLTVTGSTTTANLLQIMGVKQMASNATASSVDRASNSALVLNGVDNDLSTQTDVNMVAGEKLTFKYGTKSYTVEILAEDEEGNAFDFTTADGVAEALNASLKEVSIGDDKTLADVMKFSSVDVGGKGILTIENTDKAGNDITIAGGTNDVLKSLGFLTGDQTLSDLEDSQKVIGKGKILTAQTEQTAVQKKTIAQQLAGQSISFVYNGTVKWIEMPSEEEMTEQGITTMDKVQEYLQKELNSAFGNGRIKVELNDTSDGKKSLSFKTTVPGGAEDTTSTLSISAATGKLLGQTGLFGVENGVSNRLNLSASLENSGLVNYDKGLIDSAVQNDEALLTINGVAIEGIDKDSSISEIMEAINNNTEAGVSISYQENSDKFIITSTQNGASGEIKLEGALAQCLFGKNSSGDLNMQVTEGKDAIFAVKYAGSNEITEIVRDSNTITVDGLTITANKTFGYNENGQIADETQFASFTATVDTEKAVETVKEMIDEYNKILEHINEQVQTKPNRDYAPLTSAQKADMSENEIELWEKEAKKGLLFADTDLKSLTDSLRFVIPSDLMMELQNIGISTSSEYSDNGKLVFDESKFEAALKTNPEKVKNLFSAKAETLEDGTVTKGGFMTNMKTIMDAYASMTGSTKGILVERAGSEHSLLSTLDNSILNQINDLDDVIAQLTEQLVNEQDRYISQFTTLETLVAQMNSQSSYLASMFSA